MSDSGSGEQGRGGAKGSVARVLKWVLIAAVILFLFMVCVGFTVPLELAFQLLLGWWIFLSKNLASLDMNWEMTLCGLVALMVATWGSHRMLAWVRKGTGWKWSWTLSLTSLMLMLFASSVAMTGIIHQLAWMSKERLVQSNRHRWVGNISNAKQMFLLLVEYEEQSGKLPESLNQLEEEGFISDLGLLQYQASYSKYTEPWIYLGVGRRILADAGDSDEVGDSDAPPVHVLLISPSPNDGRWVILLSNGAAKQVRTDGLRKKYPEVLKQLPNLVSSQN